MFFKQHTCLVETNNSSRITDLNMYISFSFSNEYHSEHCNIIEVFRHHECFLEDTLLCSKIWSCYLEIFITHRIFWLNIEGARIPLLPDYDFLSTQQVMFSYQPNMYPEEKTHMQHLQLFAEPISSV